MTEWQDIATAPHPGLIWYAVNANPCCERKAAAGLREHGFTVFLPVETKWKRGKNKARERVDSPLFVGYLFVGIGPGQSLYHVRQIDGVRGLVLTGGNVPAEVHAGSVYDLQARQAAGEFDRTPAKRSAFHQGEDARILSGPFKGHIGKMLEADDEGRVKLMLSGMFAGGIVVDDDHLEPVQKAA